MRTEPDLLKQASPPPGRAFFVPGFAPDLNLPFSLLDTQ
jgi:hypothetical protein